MALFAQHHRWFLPIFLFCAGFVLVNVLHYLIFRFAKKKESEDGARPGHGWGVQKHLGKPARAIFTLTCALIALPFVPVLSVTVIGYIRQGLGMLLICCIGWFLIGCVYVAQNILLKRYQSSQNIYRARRAQTQLQLLRRFVIAVLVILTIVALLWSFRSQRLWQYGTGLLASAGLASLVLATAAKSTASNVFAGIQIALTEPFRIDDSVVVKGEFGVIEEITTAYVVVRIWDKRRLIVPLTYFIENTFENWTRNSSDLLGSAMLYMDYTVPVAAVREHLTKVVSAAKQWDKKVCNLQVNNLSEKTMELRCLVSSSNSGDLSDLKALVREEMINFIRDHYPEALPTLRIRDLAPEPNHDGDQPSPAERAQSDGNALSARSSSAR